MSFGSQPDTTPVSVAAKRASWTVLLILMVALLVASVTFDRSTWPGMFGDESTYLMAAQSLAWDGDLDFSRHDYERFVDLWNTAPEGLVLQSGDGGGSITYGKPFFYPLVLAPAVRLFPTRGPFIANVLILALASILSAKVLSRRLGELAPLWVATLIFATVVFVYAFQVHADLFLLSCSAIALSLVFARVDGEEPRANASLILRWSVVGALIGLVVYSRPLYAPLILPAFLGLPRRGWSRAFCGLTLGALIVVLVSATVHRINGGAWTSYGGERRGFYSSTGYPGVDFPAEAWSAEVAGPNNAAWSEAERLSKIPRTSLSLWGWNSLYFLVGRDIGLLPYFFPVVVGLIGWPKRWVYWSLLAALLASIAAFFLYRPFNFYGGGGAVANRYLLALYPVFWFMASRRIKLRHIIITVLVAAPFVWPLWRDPRGYPLRSNRTYAFVSNTAFRFLPYETTQSHLKPAGRSDVEHNGMWVKFLTPTLRPSRDGTALLLDRGTRGELLVGSSKPLLAIDLQLRGAQDETIEILEGASVARDETNSEGRRLRLDLGKPRATHPMWWTWNDVYIYELKLLSPSQAEGRLVFTMRPTIERVVG
jgi:hypothetical protein